MRKSATPTSQTCFDVRNSGCFRQSDFDSQDRRTNICPKSPTLLKAILPQKLPQNQRNSRSPFARTKPQQQHSTPLGIHVLGERTQSCINLLNSKNNTGMSSMKKLPTAMTSSQGTGSKPNGKTPSSIGIVAQSGSNAKGPIIKQYQPVQLKTRNPYTNQGQTQSSKNSNNQNGEQQDLVFETVARNLQNQKKSQERKWGVPIPRSSNPYY